MKQAPGGLSEQQAAYNDHLHAHIPNMIEYDGFVEGYEDYDSAKDDPDFWKL